MRSGVQGFEGGRWNVVLTTFYSPLLALCLLNPRTLESLNPFISRRGGEWLN